MEIRSYTLPYCVKTKTEKSAFQKSLEKQLVDLQALDINPNQTNIDCFQISKKELENIENQEMQAHILR